MADQKNWSSGNALKHAALGFSLGAASTIILAPYIQFAWSHVPAGPSWAEALWPQNLIPTTHLVWALALILVGVALAFARSVLHFSVKLISSWRAGIISGITQVWFLIAVLLFAPPIETHRALQAVLLAGGIGYICLGCLFLPPVLPKGDTDFSFEFVQENLKDQPLNERAVAYDLPISDWSGDRPHRGPFITSIAKEILIHKAPVIAIDGPFGEGKTSALRAYP